MALSLPPISIIIQKTINVSNIVGKPHLIYNYYKLCDGEFEIYDRDEAYIYKFNGVHFVYMGSTYFHGGIGGIYGMELLDEEYKIVESIDKLIK